MEGLLSHGTVKFIPPDDELIAANAWTLAIIRDLDTQLKEHKRKYEQAQTELRIMKAPIQYDQLPVSPDVGFGHPHNNLCIRYRQRSR